MSNLNSSFNSQIVSDAKFENAKSRWNKYKFKIN